MCYDLKGTACYQLKTIGYWGHRCNQHRRARHRQPSPPNPRVATPGVMLSGESGYRFDTRPYIPVEAAQAAVADLSLQQRCPYPPLPQMGKRGVAQLVQRPTRRFPEQRPSLLIRQADPDRCQDTHQEAPAPRWDGDE